MHPFFFSSSEKPLFGVYYLPQSTASRSPGVVLCYPMGQEYMWLHRAYRQLAMLFTKAGFHVLRFDYYGCGDSGGNSDEGSIEQWLSDISTSIRELKDSGEVSQMALVGFRLGGTLAALSAQQRGDIEAVLCWDPIVSGRDYLAELVEMQEQWTANNLPHDYEAPMQNGNCEVMGFPLTPKLKAGLEQIDLLEVEKPPAAQICIFETIESAKTRALSAKLQSMSKRSAFQQIAGSDEWIKSKGLNPLSVPLDVLQSIVTWTKEACS